MSQAKRQPSLDIIITRTWEVDLRRAGIVSERKNRPVKRNRQQIVRFLGREGTVERFAIRQTMPPSTIEPSVYPTQAQYGAVTDFFVEGCETRWQANTLLCARDYSEIVARHFSFPRERRQFLWVCIAAIDVRNVQGWLAHRGTSPRRRRLAYSSHDIRTSSHERHIATDPLLLPGSVATDRRHSSSRLPITV